MKRGFCVFLMLNLWLLSVTNVQAMQFLKNEKIGSIYFANSGEGVGGFCCENAVSNTGVYYTAHNKKNTSSYGKGVALFGAGEVLLNVHYDVYYGKRLTVVIGSDDKSSFGNITMQIDQADIYSISNDSENKIYVVYNRKNQKGSDYAIFAGSKSRIVSEVVNTAELSQRFLHGDIAEYGRLEMQDNKLYIPYIVKKDGKLHRKGKFKLTWQEDGFCFDIEKVLR